MPGGHTRESHKLRRNSAKSAQSECKECAYIKRSVKAQEKDIQGVHIRVIEDSEEPVHGSSLCFITLPRLLYIALPIS
jgi:hypothetical protein